jgi:hypothetical protein
LTVTRNLPNSNDDDDFPEINELWLGIRQKSMPASADPNGDDNGIAEMVDNGTRDGSPTDSTRSTVGSSRGEHTTFPTLARLLAHTIPDPIILSEINLRAPSKR